MHDPDQLINPNGSEFQLGRDLYELETLMSRLERGQEVDVDTLKVHLNRYARLINNTGMLRAEANRLANKLTALRAEAERSLETIRES